MRKEEVTFIAGKYWKNSDIQDMLGARSQPVPGSDIEDLEEGDPEYDALIHVGL